MSRPGSRRMLGILLLGLVAVAVSLTVLRQGFSSSSELERSYHFYYYGLAWKQVRAFNSSMLRYAEIDVLEEKLKKQAEQLLEGKFPGPWRYRSVAGARRRFNIHDPSGRSTTMIQAAYSSPLYSKYWPDFRRNLQDWARNKRFESEIMNDLVRLVKNPLDGHSGTVASGRRFASCAVVGNSGILLESSHGELIDSHEVVIRLNNARITGFERDVGSKTTVSFVNSHILHACARRRGCFCHPYGANVPMVMYMCQPVHFYDYAMCNSSLKAPLLITDPRFDILCARLAKYYSVRRFVEETGKPLEAWNTTHDAGNFHYSSGMQAIMLAVGICDKVSVFGFGKSETAKHHYHTNQKAELALHDYQAEYDLYHDLVEMPQAIPFMSDKFKFPRVVVYQ